MELGPLKGTGADARDVEGPVPGYGDGAEEAGEGDERERRESRGLARSPDSRDCMGRGLVRPRVTNEVVCHHDNPTGTSGAATYTIASTFPGVREGKKRWA